MKHKFSIAIALSVLLSTGLAIGGVTSIINTHKENAPTGTIEGIKGYENLYAIPAYNDYSLDASDEPLYTTQQTNNMNVIGLDDVHDHYRGDEVTIAVIDSGVNYTHEDFAYLNELGYSIDSRSRKYQYDSVDDMVYYYDGLSNVTDANGHGTNVAGTIASRINGVGTAGIAPNANLLFVSTPTYNYNELYYGIDYAISCGVDIISMSFVMYSGSQFVSPYTGNTVTNVGATSSLFSTMMNKAYNANILLVAAAGNDNTNVTAYPAANAHVIGVGALAKNSATEKAAYSNFNASSATSSGNNNVDVTTCGYVYVPSRDGNNTYKATSGTSFACPTVAGALALYIQSHPDYTVDSATQALFDSCDDIGTSGWDKNFGFGALNISSLVYGGLAPVSGIEVNKTSISIDTISGTSVVANVVPSNASNKTINWTVTDPTVISINKSQTQSGEALTIDGLKEGSTTLKATTSEGGYSKTINVFVSDYVSSEITLEATSTNLLVGQTYSIPWSWKYETPTEEYIEFTSNNNAVASVDGNGLIRANGVGSATINIETFDDSKVFNVTVSQPDSVSLNKTTLSLSVGSSEQLIATSSGSVIWSSSNPSVASVSNTGLVEALSAGNTTITARVGSAVATCAVTISAPTPEGSALIFDSNSGFTNGYANSPGTFVQDDITYGYGKSVGILSSSGSYYTQFKADTSAYFRNDDALPSNIVKIEGVFRTGNIKITLGNSQLSAHAASGTTTLSSGTSVANFDGTKNYFYITYASSYAQVDRLTITLASGVTRTLTNLSTSGQTTSYWTSDVFTYDGTCLASYDDETTKVVTPSVSEVDMSTAGTKTVTLTYTEGGVTVSTSYTISVALDAVTSINVTNPKTAFVVGDAFSFEGTITATYASGKTKNIAFESVNASGYNMSIVGNQTVIITYQGASTSYQITVASKPVLASISISGVNDTYPFASAFDENAIVTTATYTIGENKVVEGVVTSHIDTSVLGPQTLVVSYTEDGVTKTASKVINITNAGASVGNGGGEAFNEAITGTAAIITTNEEARWTTENATITILRNGSTTPVGNNNPSSYLNLSSEVRIYTNQVVEFAPLNGKTIEKVVITSDRGAPDTLTNCTSSNSGSTYTITPTGSAGSTGFSIKPSAQFRMTGMTIYYVGGSSFDATFEEQAVAMASYFLNLTSEICISDGSTNVSELQEAWNTLANEYALMASGAKDAFVTSNDVTIAEARDRYDYIMNKYVGEGFASFVVDGSNNPLVNATLNSTNRLNSTSDKTILISITIVMVISIGSLGLFLIRPHKKDE